MPDGTRVDATGYPFQRKRNPVFPPFLTMPWKGKHTLFVAQCAEIILCYSLPDVELRETLNFTFGFPEPRIEWRFNK